MENNLNNEMMKTNMILGSVHELNNLSKHGGKNHKFKGSFEATKGFLHHKIIANPAKEMTTVH